jgi:hypothetical protein
MILRKTDSASLKGNTEAINKLADVLGDATRIHLGNNALRLNEFETLTLLEALRETLNKVLGAKREVGEDNSLREIAELRILLEAKTFATLGALLEFLREYCADRNYRFNPDITCPDDALNLDYHRQDETFEGDPAHVCTMTCDNNQGEECIVEVFLDSLPGNSERNLRVCSRFDVPQDSRNRFMLLPVNSTEHR